MKPQWMIVTGTATYLLTLVEQSLFCIAHFSFFKKNTFEHFILSNYHPSIDLIIIITIYIYIYHSNSSLD